MDQSISSVAFNPESQEWALIASNHSVDIIRLNAEELNLTLPDTILLAKMKKYPDSLAQDKDGLDQLHALSKKLIKLNLQAAKDIDRFVTGSKLPEKECHCCGNSYNSSTRACEKLSCCPQLICKTCFNTHFKIEDGEGNPNVQACCPFCKRSPGSIGSPVKYLDKKNHRCARCFKESCKSRCAGCKTVYYCSATCQATSWVNGHKVVCPTLAAQREAKIEAAKKAAIRAEKTKDPVQNNKNGNIP